LTQGPPLTRPPMGRPVGEIRNLMVSALREQGPLPMRDLAAITQVGYDAARWTLKRCVGNGVVVKAGAEKRAHSKKWVVLYDLAPEPEPDSNGVRHGHGWVDLGRVVADWAR